MSLKWLTLGSPAATAMILSSASPPSSILITPITFAGTIVSGTTSI